jgi:exodeoxyribonuclease VII large subunit
VNDLELSRLPCLSPIPVFTGIGYERDCTILDEIAHRRFDTPSKVALHITTTIKDNAPAAVMTFEHIKLQVDRILTRERTALATQFDRVEAGVGLLTQQAGDDHRKFMVLIRTATHYQVRKVYQSLEAGYARLIGTADQTLCEADLKLKQSTETIAHHSQLQLGARKAAVEKAANTVALQAKAKFEATACELDNQHAHIAREAGRWLTTATNGVNESFDSIVSFRQACKK